MKKLTPKSTVAEALRNPRAVALAEKIHPGIPACSGCSVDVGWRRPPDIPG